MEYTILRRRGLKVSIAGLGCGGASRLGQATGHSEQESIAVVRLALELDINQFDTAEAYGTEVIVGKALAEVP
jgi:L-galactose dehydrogenase